MREIEFRGKRLDNGEWVHGSLYQDYDVPEIASIIPLGALHAKIPGNSFIVTAHDVDPETVGQLINLPDKHEQKLYKGDIVRITAACGEEYIGEVVWDENKLQWAVDTRDEPGIIDGGLWDFGNIVFNCEHLIEKIGNKWDNPELLKGEERK